MPDAQLVYFFADGRADGTRDMADVLGGKGANLAEMTNLGVPVPEESVLIAAGFLASRGLLDLEWVYVVAVASAVTGDCTGFTAERAPSRRP